MRYFLKISYLGLNFHGWQRQPNAVTVQQVIEDALSKILRIEMEIVGAGRTDTGVNAVETYAHFDSVDEITDLKRFIISLNHLIGKDIAVTDIIKVADESHARFDAVSRTYKYFISGKKNPFWNNYSLFDSRNLNIDKMNEGCRILKETEDFTSFAKLHSNAKTNICHIYDAFWEKVNHINLPDYESLPFEGFVFTITADRFLRNMVRSIVGTLIETGTGKLSIEELKNIINKKDRSAAGMSVEAQGLFLWKIKYPYL